MVHTVAKCLNHAVQMQKYNKISRYLLLDK